MGYSVGNLHLALTGVDKSAIKSIDHVISKLNQFHSALSVFSKQKLSGLTNISASMTAFSEATRVLDFKNFNSFVNRLNKLDFTKASKGFEKLAVALSPFLEKVQAAETSLLALQNVLQKASGKRTANMLNNLGGGNRSLFGGLKLGATILLAKRLATVVGGIVQKGSEYTETLNLWQVSMRDNLDLAERFITKMNKAYGISEKTLMNAQAVFKNMIGSLGQVSDTTAYMLSETLIQMSVDFASLYNTTLQQAFSKIQAMLAGQVRPIRSAGLDMTETTLFMYYQQMGGTKTMRQLNRTEKQLLSIYAVFEQMGKAGALGDMTKTLNTFANQSRITAEAWEELMTWTGVVLRTLIEESGALTFVNAQLIAMGEIMKAVAGSMGATDQNFADALFESVDETNGALDEMQGKLLDFDKFRSLQGQGENFLGIDEKLLKAITGYDSVIDQANNKAREQAEIWLTNLGFIDENSDGIYEMTEKARELLTVVKAVGATISIAFGATKISAYVAELKGLFALVKGLFAEGGGLASAIKFLISPLGIILSLVGVLYATNEDFRDSVNGLVKSLMPLVQLALNLVNDILVPIIPMLSGTLDLVGKIAAFLVKIVTGVVYVAEVIVGVVIAPIEFAIKAVATLITLLDTLFNWSWGDLGSKLRDLWSNWGVGNIMIGGAQGLSSTILGYADGGMPDKGTMFVAGEAGAEVVYNTPSGQSGIVNVKQIQQAMYGALVAYGRTQGGGNSTQPIVVEIDGERVFTVVDRTANRHGVGFAKK